ncbi:MAG: hypothetical protein NVS2B7_39860 [Herpetosiphon sp.]
MITILFGLAGVIAVLLLFFMSPRSRGEYLVLSVGLIIFLIVLVFGTTKARPSTDTPLPVVMQTAAQQPSIENTATPFETSLTALPSIQPSNTVQPATVTPSPRSTPTITTTPPPVPTTPSPALPTPLPPTALPISTALPTNQSTAIAAAPVTQPPIVTITPSATTTSNRIVVDVTVIPTALQGAWIEAVSDGVVIFRKLLSPGQTALWVADRELILNIGDTSAIRLAVNGQACSGYPGDVGRQQRNITINRAACP